MKVIFNNHKKCKSVNINNKITLLVILNFVYKTILIIINNNYQIKSKI